MLKFVCPLIVVEDIAVSRHFYETLLNQAVRYDFGEDVQFVGDFTIHQKTHYQTLLGGAQRFPVTFRSNDAELYFEAGDLEAVQARLEQSGVEFIHPVVEHPWGQRAMRLYDPDGHIIEIGETLDSTVLHLHEEGISVDAITQKTGMPREFVEGVIAKSSEKRAGHE